MPHIPLMITAKTRLNESTRPKTSVHLRNGTCQNSPRGIENIMSTVPNANIGTAIRKVFFRRAGTSGSTVAPRSMTSAG